MAEIIIYDQPLNETIRVCMRLELLFNQIDHQLQDHSMLGARNLFAFIINTLHILDRPDLKAKLAKELAFLHASLTRFHHTEHANSAYLNTLSQQLDELSRNLIDSSGKIGNRLRDMELLNTLRMHLSSPGGGCCFDLPLYHYWLQQPASLREQTIQDWLQDFEQIKIAVTLILDLVRKSARRAEKTATHGFYQELLDPQSNLRMIRIGIDADIAAYPEISIGRHFLSVRFFFPDIQKRPIQFTENLVFKIAYCNAMVELNEYA